MNENYYMYRVLQDKNTNQWFVEISYTLNKKPVIYSINDQGQSLIVNNDSSNLIEEPYFQDLMTLSGIQQVFLLITKPRVDKLLFYFQQLYIKVTNSQYNYQSNTDFSMDIANNLEDFKTILTQNYELTKDEDDLQKYNMFNKKIDYYFYDQQLRPNTEIGLFIQSMIQELELIKNQ